MPEMNFTSPLSAEHNGAFNMLHGLTDRTLHDIHDLIGAGTITNAGHWYKTTGLYMHTSPDSDSTITAARRLPGRVTDVAISDIDTDPLQAARWAALRMYAQEAHELNFAGIVLGPFVTDIDRPGVPTWELLRLDRLNDPWLGMHRTRFPVEQPGEAYIKVTAPSLKTALATVALGFHKVFPLWKVHGANVAASIVGIGPNRMGDLLNVFKDAEAQSTPLRAARFLLQRLTAVQQADGGHSGG